MGSLFSTLHMTVFYSSVVGNALGICLQSNIENFEMRRSKEGGV